MAIKVGITGPIGSIKTEALNKIMEMLQNNGKVIGGTLVSEKVEHGKVVAYYITDIFTKRRVEFARSDLVSRVKVDKLGVDTKSLEDLLLPSLQKSMEDADVIILDELGKVENTTKQIKLKLRKQ